VKKKLSLALELIIPNAIIQFILLGSLSWYFIGAVIGASIFTTAAFLLMKFILSKKLKIHASIIPVLLGYGLYYGLYFAFL